MVDRAEPNDDSNLELSITSPPYGRRMDMMKATGGLQGSTRKWHVEGFLLILSGLLCIPVGIGVGILWHLLVV